MNTLERWAKFNLGGVIGMGLQLTLLALLNRNMAGHYLFASCVAVEITLLHNFAWHWHYTWRDRRDCVSNPGSLVRFHLSNGAVSMLGNLVLMQLLVHRAHLPVLIANVIAILCCSVVNFLIGNRWVFATAQSREGFDTLPKARALADVARTVGLLLLFVTVAPARAQSQPSQPTSDPPSAPAPATSQEAYPTKAATQTPYQTKANEFSLYNLGALCGLGASTSNASNRPTAGCGVGMTLVPVPVFIEFGAMAPQANRSYLTGYVSVDSSIPLTRPSLHYS